MTEPFADVKITAKKMTAYIPVSDELAMDCGLIPDTRPPAPPRPWRTRFRYWRWDKREQVAHWAFRRIAGYAVPESDD